MGLIRVVGLGVAALSLVAGLAAAPARAVPITRYAHFDFGAEHALALDRIAAAQAAAETSARIAFELVPKATDLALAPLAISFRRWDEGLIGMTGGAGVPRSAAGP